MEVQSEEEFDPRFWVWGTSNSKPHFLHLQLRCRDLDASLRFYVEGLGMQIRSRYDIPEFRVSSAYVGFESFAEGGLLELSQMWEETAVVTGSGHFAIGVPDIAATFERLSAIGGRVENPPLVMLPGAPLVSFIRDLDGHLIELIQTRKDSTPQT